MSTQTQDLVDEVLSRKESEGWLQECPCCGGKAAETVIDGKIMLSCSRWGCIEVMARTMDDAAKIWNKKTFRYGKV